MAQKSYKFWKIMMWKLYFEKGYGLSHYIFKIIAVLGLTTQALTGTLVALSLYTIGCFILGKLWINYKFYEIEIEIANIFNPFVREVRKEIKNKRFK